MNSALAYLLAVSASINVMSCQFLLAALIHVTP